MIRREFLDNGTTEFDFRRPQCGAMPAPPAKSVEVRYLGSGGVAIVWGSDAILVGPYFSHAGSVLVAGFGYLHFDEGRIAEGMKWIVAKNVRAILTGHSHFDHIGDVPRVVAGYARDAIVYTNTSGVNMLAAYRTTVPRVVDVATAVSQPISVPRPDGTPSAIRFRAVRSDHAPQLCPWNHAPCTYAQCEVCKPWTEKEKWTKKRMSALCGGATWAYVIDLLDNKGAIAFRIYYNDAAAEPPSAIPDPAISCEHGYDLAVICMPSYDFVNDYPEVLLHAIQPRHILVSHYEDFFRKQRDAWTFVPGMSDRKANRFMKRMADAAHQLNTSAKPSATAVCGPKTDRWSMPVPQWPLYFVP